LTQQYQFHWGLSKMFFVEPNKTACRISRMDSSNQWRNGFARCVVISARAVPGKELLKVSVEWMCRGAVWGHTEKG
jgi:hypothetical protein